MVLNDRVADIHRATATNPLEVGRLLERNGLQRGIGFLTLHQIHTQMLALGTNQTCIAVAACATSDEHGRRITRTEGLEAVQVATERRCDVAEKQLRVDLNLRNQHLRVDMLLDIGIEAACELLDILGFHRQTCGVHMTTEVLQQIGARLNRLIQIEAGNAACRARGKAVAHSHHNRRTIVGLDQARGHDTDDTLHPLRVVDHRALAVLQLGMRLNPLVRLLRHRAVDALAILIEGVDHRTEVLGHLLVALDQQVYRRVTARRCRLLVLLIDAHTSCGVDAGADLEYNVVDGDRVLFEPTDLDDRQQTLAGVLIEAFEAEVSQDTVLVRQRNDIRCNAHNNQIEQTLDLRERNVVAQGIRLHQFETYTTTRQLLERILAIVALGIEYRDRLGQMICGQVMVANDVVDTLLFGIGHLLGRFDAAIERDHKTHTLACCVVYTLDRHAITLVITVGNIETQVVVT